LRHCHAAGHHHNLSHTQCDCRLLKLIQFLSPLVQLTRDIYFLWISDYLKLATPYRLPLQCLAAVQNSFRLTFRPGTMSPTKTSRMTQGNRMALPSRARTPCSSAAGNRGAILRHRFFIGLLHAPSQHSLRSAGTPRRANANFDKSWPCAAKRVLPWRAMPDRSEVLPMRATCAMRWQLERK